MSEDVESVEELLKRFAEHSQSGDGKSLAAMMLGRQGGLKGGRARADALSAERRSEIARAAALKRWGRDHG